MKKGDKVYRANVHQSKYVEIEYGYCTKIEYEVGVVDKVTPCGFWVSPPAVRIASWSRTWFSFETKKWHTSKEAALKSLQARCHHWVRHASRRLRKARTAYKLAHGKDAPPYNDGVFLNA